MELDSADLLSLAIESVENETAESSKGNKNINTCPEISKIDFSSESCNNHDVLFDGDEDILALALDSIEVKRNCNNSNKKSIVGVDLEFEDNSEPDNTTIKSKKTNKIREIEKSLVHTGDTDSSDDEDNKYFEESRYDSYGKSIKKALKETQKSPGQGGANRDSFWKGKPQSNGSTPVSSEEFVSPKVKGKLQSNSSTTVASEKFISPKVGNDSSCDPVFGIRIVNPLVSSQTINEKMAGRTPINFMKLKYHVTHGDLKSDWVIAAVIVRKFAPKVSQNGSNYSNWLLSDLKGSLKTASLFLFGRAHEELWKTPLGTVLAILNPSVFSDKKPSDFEAKLSIRSSDQVMIWGRSKDLGQCNFRKKNGEICGAFVNVSECEFCVYHVQQEYKKFNSRSELQYDGKSKINLRNKVLGKNEVFYGGKSFTSVPFVGKKVQNPKDKERLKGLGVSMRDMKKPVDKMSIPHLQRSNKVFNMLPSGSSLLPSNVADQNRLKALTSDGGLKRENSLVQTPETTHSRKNISIGTSMEEQKLSLSKSVDKILLKKDNSSTETSVSHSENTIKEISKVRISMLEKKPTLTKSGNEILFDLEMNKGEKTPSSKNHLEQDTKIKPATQIKQPLLSNSDKEISFEFEIKSNGFTPVSSSKKVVSQGKNLQKRFNRLISMSSPLNEARVQQKLVVPLVSSNNVLESPLKSPQNQNSKVQNNEKTLGVPVKVNKLKCSIENIKVDKKVCTTELNNVSTEQLTAKQQQTNNLHSLDIPNPNDKIIGNLIQRPVKNPKAPPNSGMSKAKKKALQFVKQKGPICKENPTGIENSKKGVKRPLSPSLEETNDNKKPVLSERFLQLMNKKSIHEDLVEVREFEQEMEYFDKMEKKDRLEEKMLSTFKVDCKAVTCLKCNYTWFSASEACKAEGHPTKVVDAVKRFFKCGKCENRTVSLTIIPLIPCKRCSSSNWVRAPMIREKMAKNDSLSIRGGEQKFVNSVITNASLDLLVPD